MKYKSYTLIYIGQQILRYTLENRSTRPFQRILQDIFNFPISFNGINQLLVIKDEYSRKLFPFPLVQKSYTKVFNTICRFEHQVRQQYRLSICKIHYNNNRVIIPLNSKSAYQLQVYNKGIDLELIPSYIYKPNRGVEYIGQELINKALKIYLGAYLLERLQLEIVRATTFLYSISPSYILQFHSPNKVLALQFKNYFRQYIPSISYILIVDLRLDQSGIYIYRYRIYLLKKDREANRIKRDFKVQPRRYIRYLIRYRASNIYWIQVLELDRVIITYNITFNKQTFFDPKYKELER